MYCVVVIFLRRGGKLLRYSQCKQQMHSIKIYKNNNFLKFMLSLLLLIQCKSNDNYTKTTSDFTEEKREKNNTNYMTKLE